MLKSQNTVQLTKDAILFNQGEVGDCAYLIEKGRVLIYLTRDRDEFPIAVLGEGEIFGEMSLIDNETRSTSARALEECQLLAVTKDQLVQRVDEADNVVKLLMRILIQRLRRQNHTLLGLKHDNSHAPTIFEDQQNADAVKKMRFENDIFNAFNHKEFRLYYQPIFDLHTRVTKGCEALVRWTRPDGIEMSPGVFMEVVEHSSMVRPVGRWILEEALKDMKKILSMPTTSPQFFMSVNISAKQFQDPKFLEHLDKACDAMGIQPKNLKLEVTERILTEGAVALEMIQRCHDKGFKLAIDDFGTGFSSLQYLANMPLDDVKIDRNFIRDLKASPKALAIVRSIIHMAKLMEMGVIAEGIETQEELDFLRQHGVELGQGFLVSKALKLEEFMKFISHKRPI